MFQDRYELADPNVWLDRKLGEFAWSKQREILESVNTHRYTAVQACHDVGKSFIASRVAAWWIDQHPPGEAFIVTTAPSSAQVSAILWREIAKAHRKGKLVGRITSAGYPQWKLGNGELVGYGRKPADYQDSAFQGIHARYVLVVIDEACGVAKKLFDSVDALATNEDARVLAIGNPDDPASHFAQVCKPQSGWNTIRIDGLRSPNMSRAEIESGRYPLLAQLMAEEGIEPTDEVIPDEVKPMLLSPLWVEERLARWVGNDNATIPISQRAAQNPLFTAKVRGIFPASGNDGVIPLGWVQRAVERWRDWDEAGRPEPAGTHIVGVDVARTGEDATCIATRQGDVVYDVSPYRIADTMETVGMVAAKLRAVPHSTAIVDVIGIGAGVVDRLREQGLNVVGFNAAAGTKTTDAIGEFRFRNMRAAAWWGMREQLDPSRGATLALPPDDTLIQDLTSPNWKIHSGGIIQVESKDEIRRRIGRSTDMADAVIQACLYPATIDETGESSVYSWWDEGYDDSTAAVSWGVGYA